MNQVAALTSSSSVPTPRRATPMPATTSDTAIDAILRAARDPSVDIGKMRELMQIRKEMMEEEARKSFVRAKIAMRPNLPKVEKLGQIVIMKKDSNVVIQSTAFARFEDIHDAAFPVLIAHGFDLDYRTGTRDGRVVVTAVLSHEDGHREETCLDGPLDTSGSKNNVQGVGSTLSYLKRYTMCALLNIRTSDKGEFDDDGHKSGAAEEPDTISADQAKTLRAEMQDRGVNEKLFLEWMHEERLEDLPSGRYEVALTNIRRKPKKGA